MQDNHVDPLQMKVDALEQSLAQSFANREEAWAESVHHALGQVATLLQEQTQGARSLATEVGAANPEADSVPTVARHAEHRREQQSNLAEQIYVLREEVRRTDKATGDGTGNAAAFASVRMRAREVIKAVEAERGKMFQVAMDAINSNPGAGD